jgi:hypothetical protein
MCCNVRCEAILHLAARPRGARAMRDARQASCQHVETRELGRACWHHVSLKDTRFPPCPLIENEMTRRVRVVCDPARKGEWAADYGRIAVCAFQKVTGLSSHGALGRGGAKMGRRGTCQGPTR